MAVEDKLANADDPTELVEKNKGNIYKEVFDYFQNSRGANTDIKQRQKRLDILAHVILNE